MTSDSSSGLLVLHAVRIIGFADTPVIALRFGVDPDQAAEIVLDAVARGWIQHAGFADVNGWSLTGSGRAENERQLAEELGRSGDAGEVRDVYNDFVPLNSRLQKACTDWQLRPTAGDRLEVNDHSDRAWDIAILDELTEIDRALAPLASRLEGALTRFRGYGTRFSNALHRARTGEHDWVDSIEIDSCHRVWFELHEDFVATLGIDRHAQS